MAVYTVPLIFQTGVSGYASSVVAQVYDASGNLKTTVSSNWTEDTDGASAADATYLNSVGFDTSWGACRVKYTITGLAGVYGYDTIGEAAAALTALLPPQGSSSSASSSASKPGSGEPTLYVSSDNLLYVLGLQDQIGGSYVTNATITAGVYDRSGTQVGTNVTLANVAGSMTVNGVTYTDGNYRGQLAASVALLDQTNYQVRVTITSGGNTLTKRFTVGAAYDEET